MCSPPQTQIKQQHPNSSMKNGSTRYQTTLSSSTLTALNLRMGLSGVGGQPSTVVTNNSTGWRKAAAT